MRKLLLLLLVLLLTATVGCGGTSPDADSNSNSHEKKVKSQAQQLFTPSELLTKEDAEKILSEPVGDPDFVETPLGTVCTYSPAEQGDAVRFVQIFLHQTKAFSKEVQMAGRTAAWLYDNNQDYLDQVQEIEGVGDRAYWGGSGLKAGAGLHVVQGEDIYFTITVGLGNEEDDLKASREIAEMVLNRINK